MIFSDGSKAGTRDHVEYYDAVLKQIEEDKKKKERDIIKRQIAERQLKKLVSILKESK